MACKIGLPQIFLSAPNEQNWFHNFLKQCQGKLDILVWATVMGAKVLHVAPEPQVAGSWSRAVTADSSKPHLPLRTSEKRCFSFDSCLIQHDGCSVYDEDRQRE